MPYYEIINMKLSVMITTFINIKNSLTNSTLANQIVFDIFTQKLLMPSLFLVTVKSFTLFRGGLLAARYGGLWYKFASSCISRQKVGLEY